MKVVTAEQMQALDRRTIEEVGVPGIVLMENAGRGMVESMKRRYPGLEGLRVAIVCGRGNNGGDGFVIARCLLSLGVDVGLWLLGTKDRVRGDAAVNMRIYEKSGGPLSEVSGPDQLKRSFGEIAGYDLYVDGIFGTGLNSDVRGLELQAIRFLNSQASPVAAIDIPSGLNATTGEAMGEAVRADMTATFGLPKVGQVIYPGAELVGHLEVIDIGIPNFVVEEADIRASLVDASEIQATLEPRRSDSHKGNFGHLMVLAGSPGKTGAAALTCLGALRCGAGLVTLGVPSGLNPVLEVKLTEAMTMPLPETPGGALSIRAEGEIAEARKTMRCLAVGPGLSMDPETAELVRSIVSGTKGPIVVDADGLNALAGHLDRLEQAPGPIVLTPHPGEMGKLAGLSAAEVQKRRLPTATDFSQHYHVTLVLKGARTLVASPEGEVFIIPTGNPGMASGGMGDVLTGMIASFVAQGHDPTWAAVLGAYFHGLAGDRAAQTKGPVGIIAGDLLDPLPALMNVHQAEGSDRGDE